MIHNFKDSLDKSHKADELPIWEEVYRKAFPSMQAMINHRDDGDHQRNGIDRSIILSNSKQILIDEKVRFVAYDDILLEYYSDFRRKTLGWALKPLLCDYIAYAVIPNNICYLLPVIQMQAAFKKNGKDWCNRYFISRAKNTTWETHSVCVPVNILFEEINKMLSVKFKYSGLVNNG